MDDRLGLLGAVRLDVRVKLVSRCPIPVDFVILTYEQIPL